MRYTSLIAVLSLFSTACGAERTARLTQPLPALPPGWVETQLIAGSGNAYEASFGAAAAIDADTAFVGLPTFKTGTIRPGAVQQFSFGDGGWAPGSRLLQPTPTDRAGFGEALALAEDHLAVGASTAAVPGAAWVFQRASAGWGEPAQILPPPDLGGVDPHFGATLAVDAQTLLVGAPLAAGAGGELYAGNVTVYRNDGSAWKLEQALPIAATAGARFGLAVLLRGDLAVVGAPTEADGAVYVFEHATTWRQLARLTPPTSGPASFGAALAMSADKLFVGAPNQNAEMGAVHVFGLGAGWPHVSELVSLTATPHDYFGFALGTSAGHLFVGAPNAYSGPIDETNAAGNVQIFSLANDLGYEGMLIPSDAQNGDSFGRNVAVAGGERLLVGATGKAYVFSRELGASCDADVDCSTGHCSEGTCCESSCSDVCRSCLGENHPLAGPDGVCAVVARDADPREDCEASASDCGETGSCDGEGACAFQASDKACGNATCNEQGEAVLAGRCDGGGNCLQPAVACATGYACRDGQCVSSCAADSDCAAAYACFDGACVERGQCTPDGKSALDALGNPTLCAPSICRDGACLATCEDSRDCATGWVCHPYRHACVSVEEIGNVKVDCSTPVRRPATTWNWVAIAGLLGSTVLRRVRLKTSSLRKKGL
jgi:hypothetical protein